jgi:hypothetical protein
MKSFALLILMIGVIFITVGISKERDICPPNKVEYRFVPRTFFDEQTSQIPTINSQFSGMFQDASAWDKAQGNAGI